MTPLELLIVTSAMMGLAILRFGLPMLFMWLFKFFCCRALHVPAT